MLKFLTRTLATARRNIISLLAVFFAIGAGGGYALAAGNTRTIHGCVSTRTHVLYVQKRCQRGQTPLALSQGSSPQPVTAWAAVQANGFTGAGARGISVVHVATGTYSLTATPSQCTQVTDAPIVTVNTAIPMGSSPAGQFPTAWEAHSGSGRNTFTVYTGVVASGSFTPSDEAFNVQVPCS